MTNEVADAVVEPTSVFRMTLELNTLDGHEVSEYNFTTENCNQEQLDAFRTQLKFLLIIMGRRPSW